MLRMLASNIVSGLEYEQIHIIQLAGGDGAIDGIANVHQRVVDSTVNIGPARDLNETAATLFLLESIGTLQLRLYLLICF